MFDISGSGWVELTPEARDLYVRMATKGAKPEFSDTEAMLNLQLVGLVQQDPHQGYTLIDPAYISTHLESNLYLRIATLLGQAKAVRPALEELRSAFQARSGDSGAGGLELLRGSRTINARLDQLLNECESELLVCQPSHNRTPEGLREALTRDRALLERGVEMRTLYHSGARAGTHVQEWVSRMSDLGAAVRTLSDDFQRMIIADRRVAVIPGDTILATSDEATAYVVRDAGVASFLASIFFRDWKRAVPWGRPNDNEELTQREVFILHSLAAEKDYKAIALRLGVTQRTVAAAVADLKVKLGAETLFGLACAWKELRQSATQST